MIVSPEVVEVRFEDGLLLRRYRRQLLVMPGFMHPTKLLLRGHMFEFPGIIREQKRDDALSPKRSDLISHDPRRIEDLSSLLRAKIGHMLRQQGQKRRFLPNLFLLYRRQLLAFAGRQPHLRQQDQRCGIEAIEALLTALDHVHHRLAIPAGQCGEDSLPEIGQYKSVQVLPITAPPAQIPPACSTHFSLVVSSALPPWLF